MKKIDINVEDMKQAGVQLGHTVSRLHPRMQNTVVGIRNTIHIIDLEKTKTHLETAIKRLADLKEKEEVVLFVGTKPPFREMIKEAAIELGFPYVVNRWLGGTFTNFEVLRKRAERYNKLVEEEKTGGFDKYNKKERAKKEKELRDMGTKFGGVANMTKIPSAVFIFDIFKDDACLKESRIKEVETLAITDTNTNMSLVDYPIPANDDALTSVAYILDKIKEAIK